MQNKTEVINRIKANTKRLRELNRFTTADLLESQLELLVTTQADYQSFIELEEDSRISVI